MMISNDTDRFTVAIAAIKGGAQVNERVAAYSHEKCSYLKHLRQKERDYIYEHGKGMCETHSVSGTITNIAPT